MNYRQWKKNYKKKYGVNPPLEIDKRKQAITKKKVVKQIDKIDIKEVCHNIINAFGNALQTLGKSISDAGSSLINRANELY